MNLILNIFDAHQELKKSSDPNFHKAVADSITKVVVTILSNNPTRARQLINIASIMAPTSNNSISDAWFQCFDNLVNQLNSADIQKEVCYIHKYYTLIFMSVCA